MSTTTHTQKKFFSVKRNITLSLLLLEVIWINQNSYYFWHKAWKPNCAHWEFSTSPRCYSCSMMTYFFYFNIKPLLLSHTGSTIHTSTRKIKWYTPYAQLGPENRQTQSKKPHFLNLLWKSKSFCLEILILENKNPNGVK